MSNYNDEVRRAALPAIMFAPDVAVALQVSEQTARRLILDGSCGPFFKVGRRCALLRDSFLDTLSLRSGLVRPYSSNHPGDR